MAYNILLEEIWVYNAFNIEFMLWGVIHMCGKVDWWQDRMELTGGSDSRHHTVKKLEHSSEQ